MIVMMSPAGAVELDDGRNLRALKVAIPAGMTAEEVSRGLGGLGRLDGDHAWLSIPGLKALGPTETDWRREFDGMIAVATRAGWVSSDGGIVRAHIERTAD